MEGIVRHVDPDAMTPLARYIAFNCLATEATKVAGKNVWKVDPLADPLSLTRKLGERKGPDTQILP